MLRERARRAADRGVRKAGLEVREQLARQPPPAARLCRKLRDAPGRIRRPRAKRGVHRVPLRDHIDGPPKFLQHEQLFHVVLGQPVRIARIVPRAHPLAEPLVVRDGRPPGGEPALEHRERLGVRAHPHQAVGLGDHVVRGALVRTPLELGRALGRAAGLEPELLAPLVERAAEDAEEREHSEHRQRELERQERHAGDEQPDAGHVDPDQREHAHVREPESADDPRERRRVEGEQDVSLEAEHRDGGGQREGGERCKDGRRRGAAVRCHGFHSDVNHA